jgi:outer membrane protein assembly factor BamB
MRLLLSLGLASWVVGTATAAEPARLIGESRAVAQRLSEAAAMVREGRVIPAVEQYLRILDESKDELVPADAAGHYWLPARWVVHARIAANPALLAAFRERTDAAASRLLEAGRAARDRRPLEHLVETRFCSGPTEAALDLLGDLASERGDFERARRYWEWLVPGAESRLSYPGGRGDSALIRAKLVLVHILSLDRRLESDLTNFRRDYPTAEGRIAGRTGRLADILTDLVRNAQSRVAADQGAELVQTTYGGSPSRNGIVKAALSSVILDARLPPIALPDAANDPETRRIQRPLVGSNALAFFPAVLLGHALVADARRVSAFDVATGQLAAQFDLRTHVRSLSALDLKLPSISDVRYTLTIYGDTVYARLGQSRIRGERNQAESYLAALRFQPAAAEKFQLRWLLPAASGETSGYSIFEGVPIVHDGRLFVAVTRVDGNRAVTAVACYDPSVPTPQLLWQQELFETGPDAADRAQHLLLTVAGDCIVCGPHAGAIVAVRATDGRRAWAHRYAPRNSVPDSAAINGFGDPGRPRELCPCVAADGRVFAAPMDFDGIIALDAATGLPLWNTESNEAITPLGVVDGKLICQISGFVAGMGALDAATGRWLPRWGYRVFGGDGAAPLGRGLIFDDCVCWSTRSRGCTLLRRDGGVEFVPTALQSVSAGNLVFQSNTLIVATPDRMQVIDAYFERVVTTKAP